MPNNNGIRISQQNHPHGGKPNESSHSATAFDKVEEKKQYLLALASNSKSKFISVFRCQIADFETMVRLSAAPSFFLILRTSLYQTAIELERLSRE